MRMTVIFKDTEDNKQSFMLPEWFDKLPPECWKKAAHDVFPFAEGIVSAFVPCIEHIDEDEREPELECKVMIAAKLTEALRLTRAGADITSIEISGEYAVVRSPFSKTVVNIEADSGAAMILDIVKAVM